jgi:hypothetical protein
VGCGLCRQRHSPLQQRELQRPGTTSPSCNGFSPPLSLLCTTRLFFMSTGLCTVRGNCGVKYHVLAQGKAVPGSLCHLSCFTCPSGQAAKCVQECVAPKPLHGCTRGLDTGQRGQRFKDIGNSVMVATFMRPVYLPGMLLLTPVILKKTLALGLSLHRKSSRQPY